MESGGRTQDVGPVFPSGRKRGLTRRSFVVIPGDVPQPSNHMERDSGRVIASNNENAKRRKIIAAWSRLLSHHGGGSEHGPVPGAFVFRNGHMGA
jgi:hypothetical protein